MLNHCMYWKKVKIIKTIFLQFWYHFKIDFFCNFYLFLLFFFFNAQAHLIHHLNIGWQPQIIKSGISQQPSIVSYSNFKLNLIWPTQNCKFLEMKTTYNGRRPQKIISGISQQPLSRSSSNFKLKLMGQNLNWIMDVIKTTSNGREPPKIKSEISQQPLVRSF